MSDFQCPLLPPRTKADENTDLILHAAITTEVNFEERGGASEDNLVYIQAI